MNPKTEGVLAFHAKKPADDVPYSDKGRRSAWVTGWHDAARAAARCDSGFVRQAEARAEDRKGLGAGGFAPVPGARAFFFYGVDC
jgi:ribosome modulation factor